MDREYDCVVLTYNVKHKKTYDTLCLLKAKGYHKVLVWATPFTYVKKFHPIFEHRPEMIVDIDTERLCKNFGFDYRLSKSGYDELKVSQDTPVLVCGAGLIPDDFIKKYKVINSHPGYIPLARGLDALKWAIHDNVAIGATTHIIGDEIDAGEIIERREIPVYINDTFHALSQRVYDNEIDMLVRTLELLDEKHTYISAQGEEAHKRMPPEIEKNLMMNFENYKIKYAVDRLS